MWRLRGDLNHRWKSFIESECEVVWIPVPQNCPFHSCPSILFLPSTSSGSLCLQAPRHHSVINPVAKMTAIKGTFKYHMIEKQQNSSFPPLHALSSNWSLGFPSCSVVIISISSGAGCVSLIIWASNPDSFFSYPSFLSLYSNPSFPPILHCLFPYEKFPIRKV